MREEILALRYASLSLARLRNDIWRTADDRTDRLTVEAFAQHVAALPRTAQQRNGEKSANHIASRIEQRAATAMERNALDLERLAALRSRMGVRRAESERRRWFALGRLLSRAAQDHAMWASVMALLIERGPLSLPERRALGVVPDRKAPRPCGRGAKTYHQDE